MATFDKLVKTVESLKLYQSPSALALDTNMGKKEKLSHCVAVADYLCSQQQSPSSRTTPESTKYLSIAMDMFFTLCDDHDADVRMIADESLNKVIRNVSESQLGRVQVELYKEIKKSGSARCLRTALTKFSDLVPQIRLQKCRPYVINLLPLLSKIAKRREENVHETLAECIPKIFTILVNYMSEAEIKNLMSDFLINVFDTSAVIRRSTAIILASICTSNRQAAVFLPWVLDKILSQVFPLTEAVTTFIRRGGVAPETTTAGGETKPDSTEAISSLLLGALGGCRYLLPHLCDLGEDLTECEAVYERSLQLYELCLYLMSNSNVSLVSAALEFLKQLLKTPPTNLTKRALITQDGVKQSRIFTQNTGPFSVSISNRPSVAESFDFSADDLDTDLNQSEQPLNFGRGQIQIMDSIDIPPTPTVLNGEFIMPSDDVAQPDGSTEFESSSPFFPSEPFRDKFATFPRKLGGRIGDFGDKEIPLIYCARKLTAFFLLPDEKGDLIPDSCVRVSLKVLAMDCLANVITWLPKIFLLTLYFDQDENDIMTPLIRDVANYTQHEDCQLRGAIIQLLGKSLRGALIESGDNLTNWYEHRRPDFADIVNITQNMLVEETSAITTRLTLSSMKNFMRLLLESNHGRIALALLDDLCTLVSAKYWLVKLELCSIIGDIPFLAVYHLTGKSHVQDTFLKVLLRFIGDQDARVREAAAKTLSEMIHNLYFPIDNTDEDTVTVAAMRMAESLLNPILGESNFSRDDYDIESKVFYDPWPAGPKQPDQSKWQAPVIFRVVHMLQKELTSSPNPCTTLGCYEALLRLSQAYPPVHLPRGWGCNIPRIRKMSTGVLSGPGLNRSFPNPGFELVVSAVKCLSVNTLSLELVTHGKLLSLTGRLFSGLSMELLRTSSSTLASSDSAGASDASYLSAAISHEERLHKIANDVIDHCLKLLSILCHILDETPVVIPPPKSSNLPGSANPTLSPLKKRQSIIPGSGGNEGSYHTLSRSNSEVGNPPSTAAILPASPLQQDPSKRLGYFAHSSHYLKLYEMLKGVHNSSGGSASLDNQKELTFLRHCLSCLSSILEFSLANTVGKHTEELLQYLKTVFNLDPLGTMACVQSLLRSIFRTSIANAPPNLRSTGMTFGQSGLFHVCFDQPYNELVHTFHLARDSTSTPDRGQSTLFSSVSSSKSMSSGKMTSSSSASSLSSTLGKSSDRAMLASYIRLFEPIVIKALKHYTLSSEACQQGQVLRLLIQLVQLRVNYCLLDSDKVFVNFITKQLQSIEEAHLNSVHILIPDIFRFLVLLSYEKHHSRPIIDVPRILQLCEGLYASGQPPELFVAPALIPVAVDLFCKRSNFGEAVMQTGAGVGADNISELDAQREVMLCMLLKLITSPEVIELLIRIMQSVKNEGDDRWRKISRAVTDAIIPQLACQKVRLDDKAMLDLLRRFFAALAPGTLRPVDPLLSAVLTCDIDPSSLRDVQRWLGFIVVALPILTNQSPEEGILRRLLELGIQIEVSGSTVSVCRSSSPVLIDAMASSSSQLDTSVESTMSDFGLEEHQQRRSTPPEMVIAKFLLQVIGVATSKLHQLIFSQTTTTESTTFLQQELSHLLLFVIYMFQSGRYYKVTKAARELARSKSQKNELLYSLDMISDLFIQLGSALPFLTLQWCYTLKLMHHSSQSLWVKIMQVSGPSGETSCLNSDILRRGGAILLCDYLCENIGNVEQVTWLIVNHVLCIVSNIHENPVQDFVRLVHMSAPSSGLLLQAIISRVSHLSKVSFLRETLTTVEYVHASHSGKLITFLVSKFLISPHLSLAQAAHSMACNRMEYLLSVHREEAAMQLSQEELASILETLRSRKLVQRFSRLVKYLNAMSSSFYDMSPIDGEEGRIFNPGAINVTINEEWLRAQIRSQCCNQSQRRRHSSLPDRERVCASMLSSLSSADHIIEILSQKDFDVSILNACLTHKDNPLLNVVGREVLFSHITMVLESMPKPFGFFNPACWKASGSDQRYSDRLEALFQLDQFRFKLTKLLPTFIVVLEKESNSGHFTSNDVSKARLDDLARFSVLCMDFAKWLFCNSGSEDILKGFEHMVCLSLKATATALQCQPLLSKLDPIYATSIAICLADIVEARFPVSYSHVLICPDFKESFESGQETPTMLACIKLNEMFTDLLHSTDTIVSRREKMPQPWFKIYEMLVVNLCRLPSFASYVRIPPELWRLDWDVKASGEDRTSFPNLPMDYLQDLDILKQYILRVGLLGWHSRQQFEETWMTLLSIFSISKEDLSDAEVQALSPCSVLVVQSITDMLLQTMYLPVIGHRTQSKVIHNARAPVHPFHLTKRGQQLSAVQNIILAQMKENKFYLPLNSSINLDRCNRSLSDLDSYYGFGQVSVSYLRDNIRFHAENGLVEGQVWPSQLLARDECLRSCNLDVRSCLHFLFELYSQWLGSTDMPLSLMTETVRSILLISDIFYEETHFNWMLESLEDIQRVHPQEDDVLTSLVRLGISKALSVIGHCDQGTFDRLQRSLDAGFKSVHLPARMACLHSMLYLLQCDGQLERDVISGLLPQTTDYLKMYLRHTSATTNLCHSEDHVALMWALAFYILEYKHEHIEQEWANTILILAIDDTGKATGSTSRGLYLTLLSGLQRLVVANAYGTYKGSLLVENFSRQMIKMATDLLTESNPMVVVPALQLFLTCMYTMNPGEVEGNEDDPDAMANPEMLMQAMERMSILFDCVRRLGPEEAGLLCDILPKVLFDFFPAADVVNRVISEFISPGQPHQVLMSSVMFALYRQAADQGHLSMLQDWVLSALPNFTHRSPISHSIWCLTVFFVSAATTNPYLQAMFPYVQQKYGQCQHEDKKLFCLSAKTFYENLDNTQKSSFVQAFRAVAEPKTAFHDLLVALNVL